MRTPWIIVPLALTAALASACGPGPADSAPGGATSSGARADAVMDAPPSDGSSGGTAAQVSAARAMLAQIPVGGRGPKTGYERTVVFGPAWADVDANGCGTRDDILSRDLESVSKRNSCVVVGGVLHEPYTGRGVTFTKANASAVQIDHVVPLALAWQLGAAQWPQGERVTFANDPANLLAVDGPSNQQKSDSGPDSWLPPNKAYRCTYVIRFTRVVSAYELRLTPPMRDVITSQLDNCPTIVGDPANLRTLPPTLWDRAARLGGDGSSTGSEQVTPSTVAQSADVHYANCTAVRAAGKAPLHRGDLGYRPELDRDGDGIACE